MIRSRGTRSWALQRRHSHLDQTASATRCPLHAWGVACVEIAVTAPLPVQVAYANLRSGDCTSGSARAKLRRGDIFQHALTQTYTCALRTHPTRACTYTTSTTTMSRVHCAFACACACVNVYACACVCMCMHACTCLTLCIAFTCMPVFDYEHTYTCKRARVRVCVCVHMCMCMCMRAQ